MPSSRQQPRLALGLEYDGSGFSGFQAQAGQETVQTALEQALSRVAAEPIRIHGAGRTDTGVHARGQVAHFDPPVERSLRSWLLGANSHLPPTCAIVWIKPVPQEFHARISATGRHYRYRIANQWPRPVLHRGTHAWVRQPLDAARMHAAAQCLVGEHDFSAFRARACQADHPVRRLQRVEVARHGDVIRIDVEGNAFLHHMVRNIVGSLLEVGRGERDEVWIAELLGERDRSRAGATAAPEGLCLEAVRYPAQFDLPQMPTRELRD